MKFALLLLLVFVVGCSESDMRPRKNKESNIVHSPELKHYVVVETLRDSAFRVLFESLKYSTPDYENFKLVPSESFSLDLVKFPSSETKEFVDTLRSQSNLGSTTRVPPIIHKSGFQLSYRPSERHNFEYIIIKEFENYYHARKYCRLLSNFKFIRSSDSIYIVSEENIKFLYYNKFDQYKLVHFSS